MRGCFWQLIAPRCLTLMCRSYEGSDRRANQARVDPSTLLILIGLFTPIPPPDTLTARPDCRCAKRWRAHVPVFVQDLRGYPRGCKAWRGCRGLGGHRFPLDTRGAGGWRRGGAGVGRVDSGAEEEGGRLLPVRALSTLMVCSCLVLKWNTVCLCGARRRGRVPFVHAVRKQSLNFMLSSSISRKS